jgi:hypothetical protein
MSAIDQRRARSLRGASTPAWGVERLPRRSLTATPGQPVFGGPCLSSGPTGDTGALRQGPV